MVLVAVFGFIVAAELPAFAQGGARPSSIQRRVDQLNRQSKEYERDNLRREVNGEAAKNDRARGRELEAQIRKDLEAVQAGYNQIVLAMAAKKVLTSDQIRDAVAVINESSIRLKENLALPRPKENPDKTPKTEAELDPPETALMTLRKHIYDFVMNPLFEAPAVLDIEQAKRASRDLDQIIELSENITKHQPRAKKATR